MVYSQYGEDEYVLSFFKDNNSEKKLVVEIGAADGFRFSNSYKLIQLGWSAILIEPNNYSFSKLKTLHENNNNVYLENCGCSDNTKLNVTLYCDKNDDYQQISTFSEKQMEGCKSYYKCDFYEQEINIYKTSDLFEKYNIKHIDFLSIDTESFDNLVIKGIDFEKCYITLICIEHFTDDISNILLSNNYEECYRTVGNVFFKNKNIK
jgi:FkbM family methyltransferase